MQIDNKVYSRALIRALCFFIIYLYNPRTLHGDRDRTRFLPLELMKGFADFWEATNSLDMGNSNARPSEEVRQTVVVAGQATTNFDHDSAQWGVFGIAGAVVIIFLARKVWLWAKNMKAQVRDVRVNIAELHGSQKV